MMFRAFLYSIICIVLVSCAKDDAIADKDVYPFKTPTGFSEPYIPEHNPLTYSKIKLGKKLFYDPILSSDGSISCNSCHKQSLAFSDARTVSLGVGNLPGFRNAQPLFNLAWSSSFFRDGGVTILELVPLNAIDSHVEFNNNVGDIIHHLNKSAEYRTLFKLAFNDTATTNNFLQALACFQRILVSADSPYDHFHFANDSKALNESAKRGLALFNSSKTDCFQCHSGFNFTNSEFLSNGISETYPDSGRQRITLQIADKGKFRVPSLRNIEYTAPYMHDGSFETLNEVIEHYNSGGKNFSGKSPLIRPLGLNEQEKIDLVELLKSLSDTKFIQNKEFYKE